ncbi:CHAT domain-containing protein [Lactifluus subvellereus]|nr:CHAT domain-containing protein [Lactifluus subvellereus]
MEGVHGLPDYVGANIERFRASLAFFPRSHPLRPCVLAGLGHGLYYRYVVSRKKDDLDALIPILTEALLLPTPLGPVASRFFHTTKIFYKLACCLAFRFELARDPVDLEYAIKYYRHLLTLPSKAVVEINCLEVLDNLVRLVARRIQMGTVPSPDDAEEIVGFLQRFASADPSSQYIQPILQNMGQILLARLNQSDQREECEHVLGLLAEMEKLCPSERFPEFCVLLGIAFSERFQQTSLSDHCRQASVRFNKALALLPPGHALRPLAQLSLATVLHHRFTHDKQLKSLEEAIDHSRAALSACPPGHPMHPACLTLLAGSLRWRHTFFGNAESMREADSCIDEALRQDLPEMLRVPVANAIDEVNASKGGFQRDSSLEALMEEIERQQDRLSRMSPDQSGQLDVLRSLALACGTKFGHTHELADLEEEINYHAMALAASPPDHYVRRMSLFNLGKAFQKRFSFDNDVISLEESIKCCREALELCPHGQLSRFEPLHTLAISLSHRSAVLNQMADFDESMELFQSASDEEYANPHARYEIASHWAACARTRLHPSTALAYEKAMSLMQSSFALGPTLEIQHRLLKGIWGELTAVPLECASYHIEIGSLANAMLGIDLNSLSLEKAVETLEQGRALLWSEMRGLRTQIDQLRASDDVTLVERYVAISRELEDITTSAEAPEMDPRDHVPQDDHQHADSFGRMTKRLRTLERERGEIIDQIRTLPGFKDFLKAVPFETLQTAAACGPVIIINHCRFRCDILIILHSAAPVLIPTAEGFYNRTAQLKEKLLDTRARYALESRRYQRSLRFVLSELYELVGLPVIEKLHELGIPEQSRVWWCPTSVFCSLPLHAAGPIESEGRVKRYFSDIYVSSYTQSLSALIESRKGITHTIEPPSLLIIGDVFLPGVREEIEVIHRLVQSATTLVGAKATRATVMKHLPNHRMVHFACHGSLELKRPFDSAFLLRGEDRLSLLDIVRSRLSCAEFAFLSVCHAAEWTDAHTADEALHLTAGMQYCGFRSAVGTLWAMADADGRDLSEDFYKRMFAEEVRGVPIGERSARALRDSVQKLRSKKGMTLERWVNFVHCGA